VGETSLRVPVSVTHLPTGYVLRSVHPPDVEVHLSGMRRRLFLLESTDVTVEVDARSAHPGLHPLEVAPEDVRAPPGVAVTAVEPEQVELDLETSPPEASSVVEGR
jgi:hypothetical protein